jgi:hypothetical protein
VNVLHKVHRWLRPGGRMLDMHPEPEDARVEIRDGDRLTFVGPYVRPAIYQNILAARDALDGMVGEGLFAQERSATFEVAYHFDSVDAWLAYRVERGTSTELDPTLLARARRILGETAGELLIREQMRATRYRQRRPDQLRQLLAEGEVTLLDVQRAPR